MKYIPGTPIDNAVMRRCDNETVRVRKLTNDGKDYLFNFIGMVIERTTHGAVVAHETATRGEWFADRFITPARV